MSELALPSGGTVTLRDPKHLRAKEKRILELELADADAQNRPGGTSVFLARVSLARMMITAWTLPYLPEAKLPSEDPGVFDELEIGDYDVIVSETMQALPLLFPGPVTPDDSDTPGSPTGPSGG